MRWLGRPTRSRMLYLTSRARDCAGLSSQSSLSLRLNHIQCLCIIAPMFDICYQVCRRFGNIRLRRQGFLILAHPLSPKGWRSSCLPPPLWIPAFAGMTNGGAGLTKGYRKWRMRGCRSSLSRIGVRDMLSYQSLIPAGAGTPRYEQQELWFGTANWHGGFCYAPPLPQRGTSPSPREVFDRATFSHSAIDH